MSAAAGMQEWHKQAVVVITAIWCFSELSFQLWTQSNACEVSTHHQWLVQGHYMVLGVWVVLAALDLAAALVTAKIVSTLRPRSMTMQLPLSKWLS